MAVSEAEEGKDVRRTSRAGAGRNRQRDEALAKELAETEAMLLKKRTKSPGKKPTAGGSGPSSAKRAKTTKAKAPAKVLTGKERRIKVMRYLGLVAPDL